MIQELPYQKEAKIFTEVSAEGFEINLVKTILDLLIWKRNISFITNSSVWHVWLASKKVEYTSSGLLWMFSCYLITEDYFVNNKFPE